MARDSHVYSFAQVSIFQNTGLIIDIVEDIRHIKKAYCRLSRKQLACLTRK